MPNAKCQMPNANATSQQMSNAKCSQTFAPPPKHTTHTHMLRIHVLVLFCSRIVFYSHLPSSIQSNPNQVFSAFGEMTKDNRGQLVAKQFFEMTLDASPKLLQVFHRQCWDRLPNKVRERVLAKQIEVSEADFRRHLDQINFRRARALYEPTALRKRFKVWVEFTQHAQRERLAYRHWKEYRRKVALKRLRNRIENKKAHRARMVMARNHACVLSLFFVLGLGGVKSQMHKCANAQMHKRSNAKCTNAHMLK